MYVRLLVEFSRRNNLFWIVRTIHTKYLIQNIDHDHIWVCQCFSGYRAVNNGPLCTYVIIQYFSLSIQVLSFRIIQYSHRVYVDYSEMTEPGISMRNPGLLCNYCVLALRYRVLVTSTRLTFISVKKSTDCLSKNIWDAV